MFTIEDFSKAERTSAELQKLFKNQEELFFILKNLAGLPKDWEDEDESIFRVLPGNNDENSLNLGIDFDFSKHDEDVFAMMDRISAAMPKEKQWIIAACVMANLPVNSDEELNKKNDAIDLIINNFMAMATNNYNKQLELISRFKDIFNNTNTKEEAN